MVGFPLALGPVDVTQEEFRRFSFHQLFRRQLPQFLIRMGPLLAIILIGPDILRGKSWFLSVSAFLGSLLLMLLFMIAIQAWQVRKVRRQMREYLMDLRWDLTEEGLSFQNRRASVKYLWAELEGPFCSSTTLFIHLRSRRSVALYMPLRGLPSGVSSEEVLALIRGKI